MSATADPNLDYRSDYSPAGNSQDANARLSRGKDHGNRNAYEWRSLDCYLCYLIKVAVYAYMCEDQDEVIDI